MTSEIIYQSFSARLSALKALISRDVSETEASADKLKELGEKYGRYTPANHLTGFGESLKCLALQWQWTNAIRNAEADADRFNRAARQRAQDHARARAGRESNEYDSIVEAIGAVTDPSELESLETQLSRIRLPFNVRTPTRGISVGRTQKPVSEYPEIAFVKFEIDGIPARTLDTLTPNVAYDISIHLRVANWPTSAERLIVDSVSLEDPASYSMPSFAIERPNDPNQPLVFEHTGRLVLKLGQSIGAKPFECKYRAAFEPADSNQGVELVGHRTLRLESVDPSGKASTGYSNIDSKLYDIRTKLRRFPGIAEIDLLHTMTLLSGLGNIAGQALQDSFFPARMKEKEFQKELKRLLRARADIGSQLEEHPTAGGGITDLSFHQIRLELKAESKSELTEDRLSKFADQTAQYAIATGKRIGILCVLDSRQKTSPPAPAESLISLQHKPAKGGSIAVPTIVIQGGLAIPSDLSK